MSIHAIPVNVDLDRLRRLIEEHLRQPSGLVYNDGLGARPTHVEFDPDLTTEELAIAQKLLAVASAPLNWQPDDWDKYTAERTVLVSYLGVSSPTNAQTAAALKALIRVVAAIVRD